MNSLTERTNGSIRVTNKIISPTKTEQSHRNEVNINKIIAKYKKTGFMNRPNKTMSFGDMTSFEDYHSLRNKIIKAEEDFLKLPSNLRTRFQNDPGQLIEFLNDSENLEEAVKMGLIDQIVVIEETEEQSTTEAPQEQETTPQE